LGGFDGGGSGGSAFREIGRGVEGRLPTTTAMLS